MRLQVVDIWQFHFYVAQLKPYNFKRKVSLLNFSFSSSKCIWFSHSLSPYINLAIFCYGLHPPVPAICSFISMSSSSTSSSALLLLSFSLLLQIAIGASPLFHICSTSETFTAASTYAANLNKLIGSLSFRAPFTGFIAASVGFKPDRANGIALCRGDDNATTCKTCVAEAGGEIRQRCPQQKEAIIWYVLFEKNTWLETTNILFGSIC